MRWEAWVLVALFVINEVMLIARVGKPRRIVRPWEAAVGLFEFGFYVLLVLRLAGVTS